MKTLKIKFFTPTSQVELCGHATIASFKALLDSHAIKDNNTVFMKTLAGTLSVEVNQSVIIMEKLNQSLEKFLTIMMFCLTYLKLTKIIGDKF